MTAAWYETEDQDPPLVGRALLMAGAAAFVWGAATVALLAAAVDCLWRRGPAVSAAVPGVYRPGQGQPLDLGDGLRARVELLEQQVEAVHLLCDRAADAERADPRNSHAAFIRHTAIRAALEGDQ